MKIRVGIGWWVLSLLTMMIVVIYAGDAEAVDSTIFGGRAGIIHPFLGVSESYTDNMSNTDGDEESEWVTVISPGLTLALPGTGNTDVGFSGATGAPGGMSLTRARLFSPRTWQTLLTYNPEIVMYDDRSDENFTSQQVTGAFKYCAPGGLAIDIADQYRYDQEMWGETGDELEHAKFDDNVAHAIIDFVFSSKFSITAGGSYHTLAYKHDINKYRDRDDATWSAALNYHLSPKTRVFCEYKQVDISYDEDISENRDSTEDYIYAGIGWDMTANSRGTCKVGVVDRDYDDNAKDDPSTWTAEINVDHNFTDRTGIGIGASRGYYESNITESDYYTSNRVSLTYNQFLTPKIAAHLMLSYENDDYDEIDLENDTYRVKPGISFSPTGWLTFELAYSYWDRSSDNDDWEFTTNEYTFSARAAF